jgi:chromate transporter
VLRMLNGLSTHMLGLWRCLALFVSTFFAVALLRLPLVWVLLPLGGVGIFFSLRILKREKGKAP